MLRHVDVAAGEQQAPVAVVRARRPHLLAVDDPLVAVALGPRAQAGEVGAGAGLGEQLAPDLAAASIYGQEALLLLVGALRHDRRAHHPMPTANTPTATSNFDCSWAKMRCCQPAPPRPPHSFGQVMPAHPVRRTSALPRPARGHVRVVGIGTAVAGQVRTVRLLPRASPRRVGRATPAPRRETPALPRSLRSPSVLIRSCDGDDCLGHEPSTITCHRTGAVVGRRGGGGRRRRQASRR